MFGIRKRLKKDGDPTEYAYALEIKYPDLLDNAPSMELFHAVCALVGYFKAKSCLEGEQAARTCGQYLFESPRGPMEDDTEDGGEVY